MRLLAFAFTIVFVWTGPEIPHWVDALPLNCILYAGSSVGTQPPIPQTSEPARRLPRSQKLWDW